LARLEHELGLAFEGTWGSMRRQERPWLGRPRTSP